MLQQIREESFDAVYKIMQESFPEDEYRPYGEQKLLLQNKIYRIYANFEADGKISAFLALWEFSDFIFIEHFAVEPDCRNLGLGSRILSEVKNKYKKQFCLEAEPPTDELTRRRIKFYERNGFYCAPFSYMQPAISKGRQPIPLVLMSSKAPLDAPEFGYYRDTLYTHVYHCTITECVC